MKPKPTEHICIRCKKKWEEQSVEDGPIYTTCNTCYAIMCQDEMDIAGGGDS